MSRKQHSCRAGGQVAEGVTCDCFSASRAGCTLSDRVCRYQMPVGRINEKRKQSLFKLNRDAQSLDDMKHIVNILIEASS